MLLSSSLSHPRARACLIAWFVAFCLLVHALPKAVAQDIAIGDGTGGINVATRECERPPQCFASVEARQSWARSNNCYFLEDVCSEAPRDDGGARAEDRGFWGSLWDRGVASIQYGYNFLRGLFEGLKDQIEGIIELITNAGDVVMGLIELGKAFYDDPRGTATALAELIGQGAVNLIIRATDCGPYDLGRVIGEWVSPAVMVRVATRLGRYGDDVVTAVRNTKRELGCASFVAGTLIWTDGGLAPIEQVRIGDRLLARDDRLWDDAPQRVAMTFERLAPDYHELRTEFETYRVTDEHRLWVQGKGWTEVNLITDSDVLVLRNGDARVLANTRIDEPVEVYNFSVDNTPNYYVGEHGLWAHNCNIPRTATEFEELIGRRGVFSSPEERVAMIIMQLTWVAKDNGWTKTNLSARNGGRTIYRDGDGNYWAFDTQHGRFEKHDNRGRHLGEYNIELVRDPSKPIKPEYRLNL